MLLDDPALLERTFGFAELSDLPRHLEPRFNIAPTQPVPIVRSAPGRSLDIVREVGGVRELVIAR
jgi:putative SOS response-associated peptidase YedK